MGGGRAMDRFANFGTPGAMAVQRRAEMDERTSTGRAWAATSGVIIRPAARAPVGVGPHCNEHRP